MHAVMPCYENANYTSFSDSMSAAAAVLWKCFIYAMCACNVIKKYSRCSFGVFMAAKYMVHNVYNDHHLRLLRALATIVLSLSPFLSLYVRTRTIYHPEVVGQHTSTGCKAYGLPAVLVDVIHQHWHGNNDSYTKVQSRKRHVVIELGFAACFGNISLLWISTNTVHMYAYYLRYALSHSLSFSRFVRGSECMLMFRKVYTQHYSAYAFPSGICGKLCLFSHCGFSLRVCYIINVYKHRDVWRVRI